MNFIDAIKACLRNYANFDGRSSRAEYWWFHLFCFLILVGGLLTLFGDILIALALLPPSIAVNVRRLHDVDKSGWWMFIAFVPLVGPILLFIWHISRGTTGYNRFGPDPFEYQRTT